MSTLMGVIIGGLIGIIPSVITPFLTYKRKKAYEMEKFEIEKIERAAILITKEVENWSEKIYDRWIMGKDIEIISPIDELEVLIKIYFKNASVSFVQFKAAFYNYYCLFFKYNKYLNPITTDEQNKLFISEKTELQKALMEEKSKLLEKLVQEYQERKLSSKNNLCALLKKSFLNLKIFFKCN